MGSIYRIFGKDQDNCARCQKLLGILKKEPEKTWGFEGKICKDCDEYIRRGIATYRARYMNGSLALDSNFDGLLSIHLFDHKNLILFGTKDKILTEISSEMLTDCKIITVNEKSAKKQILTVGISNTTAKRYLGIEFKDREQYESMTLDVDYPLETVLRNIEPIIAAKSVIQKQKRESDIVQNDTELAIKESTSEKRELYCGKCGFKNIEDATFCSDCGNRLQTIINSAELSSTTDYNHSERDYILSKGEKTKEEKKREEEIKKKEDELKAQEKADKIRAEQLRKPQSVFDVKYLGGHMMYPTKKPRDAKIGIFIDRIEIKTDRFVAKIPYERISSIKNMDEKRMSALRVVGLGFVALPLAIVGAMWKKKKIYTVIEYNDDPLGQTLVFDFGKHLESKQRDIYSKIVAAKTKKE